MGFVKILWAMLSKIFSKKIEGYITDKRITPEELFEAKRQSVKHPEIFEKIIRKRIEAYEMLVSEYQKKGLEVPQVSLDNLNILKEALRNK